MAKRERKTVSKDTFCTIAAVIAFLVFFSIGFSSSRLPHDDRGGGNLGELPSWVEPENTNQSSVLAEQVQAQREFQAWIFQQQNHPTDCSRILRLHISKEYLGTSAIDSVEILARALKIALSTERRLVVSTPDQVCDGHHPILCSWISTSKHKSCSSSPELLPTGMISPAREGILPGVNTSDFFNVQFYGPTPEVEILASTGLVGKKSWLLDSGLPWERTWGAYWIRSQLLYYLFQRQVGGEFRCGGQSAELLSNLPVPSTPTIVLVWDTVAQETAQRRFARNSSKTHSWDRIEAIAQHLRHVHGGDDVWTFSTIETPPASSPTIPRFQMEDRWEMVTIVGGADNITMVLEHMSTADYVIGSFTSIWFRVATALNTACLAGSYPLSQRRVWSLDVEWLEDL